MGASGEKKREAKWLFGTIKHEFVIFVSGCNIHFKVSMWAPEFYWNYFVMANHFDIDVITNSRRWQNRSGNWKLSEWSILTCIHLHTQRYIESNAQHEYHFCLWWTELFVRFVRMCDPFKRSERLHIWNVSILNAMSSLKVKTILTDQTVKPKIYSNLGATERKKNSLFFIDFPKLTHFLIYFLFILTILAGRSSVICSLTYARTHASRNPFTLLMNHIYNVCEERSCSSFARSNNERYSGPIEPKQDTHIVFLRELKVHFKGKQCVVLRHLFVAVYVCNCVVYHLFLISIICFCCRRARLIKYSKLTNVNCIISFFFVCYLPLYFLSLFSFYFNFVFSSFSSLSLHTHTHIFVHFLPCATFVSVHGFSLISFTFHQCFCIFYYIFVSCRSLRFIYIRLLTRSCHVSLLFSPRSLPLLVLSMRQHFFRIINRSG